MSDILLDYTFKVNDIIPTPPANKAYLRKVLAVVKPLDESVPGEIVQCTNKVQVSALTANQDVAELFNGGLNSVYVLPVENLNISDVVEENKSNFYTLLVSSDFDADALDNMNVGSFDGIKGYAFNDDAAAKAFANVKKQCAFYSEVINGAKNMFYAFGALLSSGTWRNQQYITMPYSDNITELGIAENYFSDRISFVLSSPEFGNRLAFFVAGGDAIIAPYVYEEITLSLQSRALQFISQNNPQYTVTEAALLEDAEQQVIDTFIQRNLIRNGTITITLVESNFIVSGSAYIPPPTALWRGQIELVQEA